MKAPDKALSPFFLTILLMVLLGWAPLAATAKISLPFLVGNFNVGPEPPALPSSRAFAPLGERFVLQMGERLWLTDGTEEGTFALCEPTADGPCPQALRLLAGGARVYFEAADRRLWVTDGTLDGTIPLTDPPVGFVVGFASQIVLAHPGLDLFFFAAHHPLRGSEPWVTDGTREGTRELADLAPGGRSSNPRFQVLTGGRIVFTAEDLDHGREPWVSDGTSEGTRRLRDVRMGPESSRPDDFRSLGDLAAFTAENAPDSRALWVTDGTGPGTRLLLDLGSGLSEPTWALAAETAAVGLYFYVRAGGGEALWITGGTPESTRELHRFDLQIGERLPPRVAGNQAFFRIEDVTLGIEPWVSDGTAEGTRALDLCPGTCSSTPFFFQPLGNRMFFVANVGGTFERDVFLSDGTPAGTRTLGLDLELGSVPTFLANNDRRLFFLADTVGEGRGLWVSEAPFLDATRVGGGLLQDPTVLLDDDLLGLTLDAERGAALWRSDATAAGTRPVRTLIEPGEGGSRPSSLTRVGDRVFFVTSGNPGAGQPPALWSTGGTPPSTVQVFTGHFPEESLVEANLQSLTALGDRLLFLSRNPQGDLDLWALQSDGETAVLLETEITRFLHRVPLAVVGDLVFLPSGSLEKGGLWITDGTVTGTRRVHEVSSSEPESRATFQGRLFFSGIRGGDAEPWVSDGTPEGTFRLADLNPDGSSDPRDFTPFGDFVYFAAGTPDGRRLFRTDGTPDGTREVDLPPAAAERPVSLAVVGDRLVFVSFLETLQPSLVTRHGLWSTDGTREGTELLSEPLFEKFQLRLDRQVLGPEMFFLVPEPGPAQIWRTDGTAAGTVPWRFLPSDRSPVALHGVDTRLVIDALGPEGREIWWSEDNQSGAELVGAFGDDAGELTRLGQLVLFRGERADIGSELWAFETQDFGIDPPPGKPAGVPDAPDRLDAFSTDVTGELLVTWRDRSTNETAFVLQAKSAVQPFFETVAVLPAGIQAVRLRTSFSQPVTLRVRAENANGVSDWSAEASGTSHLVSEPCVPSDDTLCLLGGRFRVRVTWRDPFNGGNGIGHARPFDFSDDSGTFWFFDPDNVELVVKVLDAQTVNGFYWFFYGALSNVEYWLTVTDVLEGTSRTYHNPPRNLCGLGDTQAFPRFEPAALRREEVAEEIVDLPNPPAVKPGAAPRTGPVGTVPAVAAGSAGTCAESATALCLTGERYRVEVRWSDPRSGDTGRGFAIPATDDSGFFWFFDPENVELVVKVLDGRTVNGNFWFFYGALSDVEYTIMVTDTVNDIARTYRNPPFEICGRADTAAF